MKGFIYMKVNIRGIWKKIVINEIVAIESNSRKTIVYINSAEISSNLNLKSWKTKLTSDFIEIHRGVLININEVTEVFDGNVVMSNAKTFPVSRRKFNETIMKIREVDFHLVQ